MRRLTILILLIAVVTGTLPSPQPGGAATSRQPIAIDAAGVAAGSGGACTPGLAAGVACATSRDVDQVADVLRKEGKLANAAPGQDFVPGELIVKFSDSLTQSASDLINKKRVFQDATVDRSDSLDRLIDQYNVDGARPVFRTPLEEEQLTNRRRSELQRQEKAKVDTVQQRFPARSARAPQGVVVPDLSHIYVLELPQDADVAAAAQAFAQDPHVEYAQPNYIVELQFAPDDPYYQSSGSWGQPYDDLWGLKKIQAGQAWDLTQGEGVVVSVVDTGLDYNHPDIAANVWTNTDEIPDNGLDDDGNGYIDDVRGWDFDTSEGGVDGNDPMDVFGHGTHVSGTIAAVGNNGLGVIGVAPQAEIMPLKAVPGPLADAVRALRYAADNGADVINNSWSCNCPSSPILEEAVRYAHGLGVVIVFAAGNNARNDIARTVARNQPETIVVSAFDENDEQTLFTNFGLQVDVAAPGGGTGPPPDLFVVGNILSLRSALNQWPEHLLVGEQYVRLAGTSMSAPHVSGLAALILARRPAFLNEEVRQVLRISADDVAAPGFDVYSGRGRINAAQALTIDAVLRVSITAPAGAAYINTAVEHIEIRGTAAGPGFVSYELSYGEGWNPAVWSLIASSTTPAEDGVLATWDAGALPSAEYSLRLEATDAQGLVYDAYIASLIIENPAPLGDFRLAYQRFDPAAEGWQIYAWDAAALDKLTNAPGLNYEPAWSSDGSTIAFQSDRDEQESIFRWEIYVMNADGSGQTRLTNNTVSEFAPAWSPDGSKIAYERSNEIYVMNADGSSQTRLTNNTVDDYAPAWSPDGLKIAFSSKRDQEGIFSWKIYVMNPDGSGQTGITNNQAADFDPAWSPDGTKIAFTSVRDGNAEIYVMSADGSGQTRLTNDPVDDYDPAWSPDGSKIAFIQDPGPVASKDIYVINADGSDRTRLTAHPDPKRAPSWGPPPPSDSDNDGCTDEQELGPNPANGGQRDPLYFWDFMDQWTGSPFQRDRVVVAGDIGAVVARFGTARGTPPTKAEALAEALTPPTDTTSYHPIADRGGSLDGNPLHLAPPDGSIIAGDIGAVVAQFGHSCA